MRSRPVAGRVEHRARSSATSVDDAAVAEEHHPVGPRREVRVVGDDDRGDPSLAGVADHRHHGLAVGRVERARRLVGEEEVALPDDGAGDGDPLALAAGELVGVVVGPIREPELVEGGEPGSMGLRCGRCRRAPGGARRSPRR